VKHIRAVRLKVKLHQTQPSLDKRARISSAQVEHIYTIYISCAWAYLDSGFVAILPNNSP